RFDAETGTLLSTLELKFDGWKANDNFSLLQVALSPDGETLVMNADTHGLREETQVYHLYDARTFRKRGGVIRGIDGICHDPFSRDGKWLLAFCDRRNSMPAVREL